MGIDEGNNRETTRRASPGYNLSRQHPHERFENSFGGQKREYGMHILLELLQWK